MKEKQLIKIDKKEKEDIDILFDPSIDPVLGVFGNNIHVLSHYHKDVQGECEGEDCVLIIPENIYFKIWKQWIQGKRDYCENNSEYCGVIGYVFAEEFKEVNKIILNTFNSEAENEEDWYNEEVSTRAFKVTKFSETCDFEHG